MSAEYPYLDSSLSPEQRAGDLLSRMSLEDKAGQLFHSQIRIGPGGTLADADPDFGLPGTEELVLGRRITHFNLLRMVQDPRQAHPAPRAGRRHGAQDPGDPLYRPPAPLHRQSRRRVQRGRLVSVA